MPARCLLRLSDAERELVAGFRDGKAGSHIPSPSAAVMYDLLVPITAAFSGRRVEPLRLSPRHRGEKARDPGRIRAPPRNVYVHGGFVSPHV